MNPHPEPGQLERLLAEICRLRHRRVHAFLRSLGLHKGQPSLLRALWEQEGLTHTDLARRLCVQPATITKMVSRMEKAGFLERRPDPSDQRISRVYLTPSGRAIQEDVENGRFDPVTMVEVYAMECDTPEGKKSLLVRERSYVPTELVMLFRQAGFEVEHIWGGTAGNWGRRKIHLDEMEVMVVARKAANASS
ncbi:MAG TPA: MarR family transcriptional regulator, partial [Anaerolineae bacterium]|nr:MarR family transcriptional regulator [Anaerolineae bacterium]